MSQAEHLKLAVLIHAADTLESPNYLLNLLIGVWRRSGAEVTVIRGTDHFQAADALFMHVDLTVVPPEYLAFAEAHRIVINGMARDISKRKISTNLLQPGDPYAGEVIVKSDLNYGGRRELTHRNVFVRQASTRLPWGWNHRLSRNEYPIFPSAEAVPRAVWRDRRLVVERFLPEREGEYYCLRQWVFLGDHGVSLRLLSRDPIVKAKNVVHREYDVPIPDTLRQMRARLGFDYGKFDYVVFEGEAQLLDANFTPTFNPAKASPRLGAIVDELAQGLDSLLTHADPAVS